MLVPENIEDRTSETVHAADESVIYGDVNSDSKIDILDMILLKSYLVENNTKGFSVKAADLDDDGKVSSKDAVELSMYLMNRIGSFSYEMNVDTDGDGLSDYIEKEILGTDYQKKDTDGDGLDDYSEVYLCDTDPLSTDTGKTGVKDSLKDTDGDKLTNAEEIILGTSPTLTDTDEDGLSDYDEVKKYKTDPLKEDTDGDGISDNGEIKLGLDPIKVKSDGKNNDNERIIEQNISENSILFENINNEESNYSLSLNTFASGYAEETFGFSISKYTNYINSEMIFGDIIDIDFSDKFILEKFTLNFTLPNDFEPENFMIFKYSEEANTILPAETIYGENSLSVIDEEFGTYCLVCLDELNISEVNDNYYSASNVFSSQICYDLVSGTEQDDNVEVYFIMYSLAKNLESVKSSVQKASVSLIDYCNKADKKIKFYYSGYNGIISSSADTPYLNNLATSEDISSVLNLLKAPPTNEKLLANYSILKQINATWNNYACKSDAKKYYFIINAGSRPPVDYTRRVESTINNGLFDVPNPEWNAVDATDIYYSDNSVKICETYGTLEKTKSMREEFGVIINLICDKENAYLGRYKSKLLSADKDAYYFSEDFSNVILSEVASENMIVTQKMSTGLCNEIVYDINLVTEEWKEIFEKYYYSGLSKEEQKKYFDEINKMGLPDTDGDGICDCLEINMRYITFDKDGKIILPTYAQLGGSGMDELIDIMNKRGIDIRKIRILPLLSNPVVDDSDGDGIKDKDDENPTQSVRVLILDNLIDDSNIFSNKNDGKDIICEDSVISNKEIYDHGELITYKPKQVYQRYGSCQTVSSFKICPEDYSDYKMTLTSNAENTYTVKILDISNPHKVNKVDYFKSFENGKTDHVYCFSLKQGRTYNIDVIFNPFTNVNQNYSVSFEQDNWVYAENGGFSHSIEHLEGSKLMFSDYVDVYITEEMLKGIVTHEFDNDYSALRWNKNAKNFNSLCADALKCAVYNENKLEYLSMNKSECVWSDSVSTIATGTGVALLAFGTKLPFGVGAFVTVGGGVATYFSMLSSDPESFKTTIANTFNKINDQFDDTDKLNIRLQKYRCFGVEKFASYEWENNTESYSYIND